MLLRHKRLIGRQIALAKYECRANVSNCPAGVGLSEIVCPHVQPRVSNCPASVGMSELVCPTVRPVWGCLA